MEAEEVGIGNCFRNGLEGQGRAQLRQLVTQGHLSRDYVAGLGMREGGLVSLVRSIHLRATPVGVIYLAKQEFC